MRGYRKDIFALHTCLMSKNMECLGVHVYNQFVRMFSEFLDKNSPVKFVNWNFRTILSSNFWIRFRMRNMPFSYHFENWLNIPTYPSAMSLILVMQPTQHQ